MVLDLELGEARHDVVDLLLKLKREQGDHLGERSAETLRLIISVAAETVEITEDSLTTTTPGTEAYVWGDDVGQELIWDAGTWG